MSADETRGPRTLRLEDTVILLDAVRAASLEPSYSSDASDGGWITRVFFHGLEHPLHIRGDHVAAISAAIETLWG